MQPRQVFCDALVFLRRNNPTWESVYQQIVKWFPTFQRSPRTLRRWYHKYLHPTENAQLQTPGPKLNKQLMNNLEQLLRSSPSTSQREASKVLDTSARTIARYIKHHIHFVRRARRRIPYKLTEQQKHKRVLYARILLSILDVSKEIDYANLVTGDESYFLYDYEPHWWYVPEGERPPPQVHSTIGISKLMLTVFLWGGGLALLKDTPQGLRMNSDPSVRIHFIRFSIGGKKHCNK